MCITDEAPPERLVSFLKEIRSYSLFCSMPSNSNSSKVRIELSFPHYPQLVSREANSEFILVIQMFLLHLSVNAARAVEGDVFCDKG